LTGKKHYPIFWQVHPLKEETILKSILLCQIICLITVASYYYVGPSYGIMALIILVLSLNKYFFKTSYTLDDDLVRVQTGLMTITKRWDHFQRFVISDKQIQLSPLSKPSRLDQFQALSIRLSPKVNKSEIEGLVRLKLEKHHD